MNNADIQKLKVLHIISGDLWAGAESMAFNLISQLRSYPDFYPVIILLNEGALAEKLRGIGVTVHVIDEKQLSFFKIVQSIRKIVRTNHPDIIHSHRYKENIIAFLAALFNQNIKLIATQHGLPEKSNKNGTLLSRFISKMNYFLLSKCFTKIVAVSADVKNNLITDYAVKEKTIESIHNGIEIPDVPLSRHNSRTFVIGSSGRLFPVKDYRLMVEIARVIRGIHGRIVHFQLAGEGPERSSIESLIKRYNLNDSFILMGQQNDMDSFYDDIDVYLNTSIHEGIPMTILEALARGIPVIAPAVGGINEIITNGVEGFLIENRTPEIFADRCMLLQENRELREKMSRAARKLARKYFSADKMAREYHRLYYRTRSPIIQYQESDAIRWARQSLP